MEKLPRSGVLQGTLFFTPSRGYVSWYPWTVRTSLADDIMAIGPLELPYTIPADFNPIPAVMAAAEAEKLKALEEYQKRVAEINEVCSRYLAIEAAPTAGEGNSKDFPDSSYDSDPETEPFNQEGF